MKKAIFLFLSTIVAMGAAGQTPEQDLRNNPARAGANYHTYEFGDNPLTPAPEGFKPFYISHYGRHGSRNLTHDSFKYPVSKLRLMKEKGLLNAEGKELLKQVERLYKMSGDHWGDLTPRGREEHVYIALEMARRFPEIFDGTPKVRARSSYSERCLESMDCFVAALAERNPGTVIDKDGGKQYRYYLNDLGKEVAAAANDMADSLKTVWLDPGAFLAPLVTDTKAALALMSHPDKFEWQLGEVCLIAQCMPGVPDMTGYMPFQELVNWWKIKNFQLWFRHGISPDFGAKRVPLARNRATDFIQKADSVIRYGGIAADVRFGHDSALLPLMCYLGAAGHDKRRSLEEAETWHSYEYLTMAANFQLVFYRDPVGRILVQGILNGRETCFPALGPGPFYPWAQFRNYVLGRETFPF